MAASNEVLFITGGDTGLGYATVQALCQSSLAYTVLLGGRDLTKAEEAVKRLQEADLSTSTRIHPVQVDVQDDGSIADAVEHVNKQYGRLDVLINNAGAMLEVKHATGELSAREMWNHAWDINTTGAHLVTHAFAPLLLKSANPRLLFISSGSAALAESKAAVLPFDQSPPAGWPKQGVSVTAYRSAKAGLNMVMCEWTRLLKADGVKVWAVSPGYLATGLGPGKEFNQKMGAVDPSVGAEFIRGVIEGARNEDVGKEVRQDGVQPW